MKLRLYLLLLLLVLSFAKVHAYEAVEQDISRLYAGMDTSELVVPVELKNMGPYYQVFIDLSAPWCTRRSAGKAYGAAINGVLSNYGGLLDSYIAEFLKDEKNYSLMLTRMRDIWPNMPDTVRDEIEGIADSVCRTERNVFNDGLLSPDEFRVFNLMGDIFRATNCSAVGVLPEASASGNLIVARNVDWDDGKMYQFSRIQAVVTYKLSAERSITLISYLGIPIALTGISSIAAGEGDAAASKELFFALLDSDIGKEFSSTNKRSFPADLREYAEQADSVAQISVLLDKTAKDYTFGHLIFLADKDSLGVYEDNLTYAESKLRKPEDNLELYLPWKIPGTIGAVNCFMLKTSLDNTMGVDARGSGATQQNLQAGDNTVYVGNVKRWATQQRLLTANGKTHSFEDLKLLSSFGPGKATEGFLYRPSTQEITVFEPATGRLEVAFHPIGRDIEADETPVFRKISLPQE